MFLKIPQYSKESTYASLQLYQKETPTQLLSCAYCKIFKNSFSYRTPAVATSDISRYETGIVELRKQRIKERLNLSNGC